MEEKGARVVVVKGVRNIKYFLIASSLPCVAAIQQSLHEDYELTQGKQLKRSRALYIYIYKNIYIALSSSNALILGFYFRILGQAWIEKTREMQELISEAEVFV